MRKHGPSNFELMQEITKEKRKKPPMGEIWYFIILIIALLSCFGIIMLNSHNITQACSALIPILSFCLGLVMPDLKHKL